MRSRTARLVYRLLLNRPHRRLKTRAVGAAWFLSANTVQQAAKREWWRAQRSTQNCGLAKAAAVQPALGLGLFLLRQPVDRHEDITLATDNTLTIGSRRRGPGRRCQASR